MLDLQPLVQAKRHTRSRLNRQSTYLIKEAGQELRPLAPYCEKEGAVNLTVEELVYIPPHDVQPALSTLEDQHVRRHIVVAAVSVLLLRLLSHEESISLYVNDVTARRV